MHNLLLSSIFAWPILAITLHMLLSKNSRTLCQQLQTISIICWIALILSVFLSKTGIQVVSVGHWSSAFAINLVFDALSRLMLLVFAIVASCVSFYSYRDKAISHQQQAFYAGFWLLLLAASGALCSADIFNLYVWFEVMLVSAFILLASGCHEKPRAILHYATLNIIGTLLMLLAIALLYGTVGSLNYASIALALQHNHSSWLPVVLGLLVFALATKGAIFPLYFWLPKAYTKPSNSSTMLLSSIITKVVMLVLLRLVYLWSPLHDHFFSQLLLIAALATMLFGVLGAANQFRFKNILAFHIISQLGYILLAIALPTAGAIIAAVYFIIHNMFVKTNLFMVAGIVEEQYGTDNLKKLGNLLAQHKWLATSFFIAAMSLAGFPPLSGFWAKLLVIKAALQSHWYLSAAFAIVVSLLTLYSMIKLWRYVFCQPASAGMSGIQRAIEHSATRYIALLPLLLLPIVMGLWPDSILQYLHIIATQFSHPEHYLQLVTGA